jgi:hypothetical protein
MKSFSFPAFSLGLALLAVPPSGLRAATFVVSNTNDSGPGSLRQALIDANTDEGEDAITFQISGTGVRSIALRSPLPPVLDPVTIDGTTQPGYSNQPLIELNGASAGENSGLRLLAGDSRVRGLAINRFAGDGIYIEGPGRNVIQANRIGTDAGGTANRGNGGEGIFLNFSTANLIGGNGPGEGNVISGNRDAGIYVLNGGANLIQGNYIGTKAGGIGTIGNANNGIALNNTVQNVIGGTTPGARNVISGNRGSGIHMVGAGSTGNLIRGNYIGTDASGKVDTGNTADGITMAGVSANSVGGTNAAAGNLISGNEQVGVFLSDGAATNLLLGNLIGTDVTGKLPVGNGMAGIAVAGAVSNIIGWPLPGSGNVISGNKQDGIFLATNSIGNLVQGNLIGVDVTGARAVSNVYNGITISGGSANRVGGVSPGTANVISGNAKYGLHLLAGSAANFVQGNRIGTDLEGRAAIPNRLCGIRLEGAGNVIGDVTKGGGNLISGNIQDGVFLVGLAATGNAVRGNYIGTDLSGTNALGNGRGGIGISDAPANHIGGVEAGAGNVISANKEAGVFLIGAGATQNRIEGNKIGTDAPGLSALGNRFEGIYAERVATNYIGGNRPEAGNIISGNRTRGIWLTNASWNVIQGNRIGTAADGFGNLGNVFHAIECETGARHNQIGGPAGAGNRIAHSQTIYAGVRVRDGSLNNAILGNEVFGNGGLGIDLGEYGVARNDACDADSGANALQNYPVLAEAITGGGTKIRGSLNSVAGGIYTLQFFASAGCSPMGNGQGEQFLGEKVVEASGGCGVDFEALFPANIPAGYSVTATATDPSGNTSEMSACVPVREMPGLAVAMLPSNECVVSWPASSFNCFLTQTDTLTPPVRWIRVPDAPSLVGGQWVVRLSPAEGGRFYTLAFE